MKARVAGTLVVLLTLTIVPEAPLSIAVCTVLSTAAEGQVVLQCAPRHRIKVNNQVQLDAAPTMRTGS